MPGWCQSHFPRGCFKTSNFVGDRVRRVADSSAITSPGLPVGQTRPLQFRVLKQSHGRTETSKRTAPPVSVGAGGPAPAVGHVSCRPQVPSLRCPVTHVLDSGSHGGAGVAITVRRLRSMARSQKRATAHCDSPSYSPANSKSRRDNPCPLECNSSNRKERLPSNDAGRKK